MGTGIAGKYAEQALEDAADRLLAEPTYENALLFDELLQRSAGNVFAHDDELVSDTRRRDDFRDERGIRERPLYQCPPETQV